MGEPVAVALRRAGERERGHAGHLRRDDVHHHRRDERRLGGWNVQPHPVDRHVPHRHHSSGRHLGHHVAWPFGATCGTQPGDSLLQAGTQVRVQCVQGSGEAPRRNLDRIQFDTVEGRGLVKQGPLTVATHRLAQGTDDVDGRLDVERRTGNKRSVVELLAGAAPSSHVDQPHHGCQSRTPKPAPPPS